MAVRADMISNRRHVQRALQAVGFVALFSLVVAAGLTARGVFAGGLAASSVKPAYAPILTDTTDTPTGTYTSTPTYTPTMTATSTNTRTATSTLGPSYTRTPASGSCYAASFAKTDY